MSAENPVSTPEVKQKENKPLSEMSLQERRKFAADVKFSQQIFTEFLDDGVRELRVKKSKGLNTKSDTDIASVHFLGLFDAYTAKKRGGQALDTFRRFEEKSEYLENRLDALDLDTKEKKIIEESQGWQDSDVRRVLRDAYSFADDAPDVQKETFYQESGLEKEKLKDKVKRRILTLGINSVTVGAVDGVGHASGAVASMVDPLPTDNKYALGAFVLACYGPYIASLRSNQKENISLLEERGVGLNALSEWVYKGWKFKKGKDAAANGAFYLYNLYKEWQYVIGGIAVYATTKDLSALAAYSSVATLAAAKVIDLQTTTSEEIRENGMGKDVVKRVLKRDVKNMKRTVTKVGRVFGKKENK